MTKPEDPSPELGFTWRANKKNEVTILHRGRTAAVLRGRVALDFLADAESLAPADLQQLMARLTGNYKRGNERTARNHPRNRP